MTKITVFFLLLIASLEVFGCVPNLASEKRRLNAQEKYTETVALGLITSYKRGAKLARKGKSTKVVKGETEVGLKIIGGWGKKVKSNLKVSHWVMNSATGCQGNRTNDYLEEGYMYYIFLSKQTMPVFAIRLDRALELGYFQRAKMDFMNFSVDKPEKFSNYVLRD